MASLQELGTVRFYRETPDGHKVLLGSASVTALAPQGGAPEGLAASVLSPDEWIAMAKADLPEQRLRTNDILLVTFESVATDGVDVSDSLWNIPVASSGQTGVKYLSQGDFANPAAIDFTATANLEHIVAGYRVLENSLIFGGLIYADIQDDTA